MSDRRWNPRYTEYCRAHGEASPERMLEADRERSPGGVMCGFTLWIQEKWSRWRKLNGIPSDAPLWDRDHAAFDSWLAAQPAETATTT